MDLNLEGKEVVIVGGGDESESKALKLLDGGAKITVVWDNFTVGLMKLGNSGSIRLVKDGSKRYGELFKKYNPAVVLSATGNLDMDYQVAKTARSDGALVCVVDRPYLNDFNMPAIAKIGDIRVAISTEGLSPAMASIIRKRVENMIRLEDVLQVKLQTHLRKIIKKTIKTPSSRKELVYKIIRNQNIIKLLQQNRFEEAKGHAEKIVQSSSDKILFKG